jgi:hypothetical protein
MRQQVESRKNFDVFMVKTIPIIFYCLLSLKYVKR